MIVNGDLTAFGRGHELEWYKEIYGKLIPRVYPGLGNHDYANNVDECAQNQCANRMVLYLRDEVRR